MQAYCVRCKAKREIQDAQPVFTRNGTAATQGVCPECGTKMFRMGGTPAHAGLDPLEHLAVSRSSASVANQPRMVIVESPAKARTVGRFLGKGYRVRASVGHIRDLPANRMGVDIAHGFRPRYVIPAKRKDVVRKLREDVKKSSELYLATDPDREGEAISWHLQKALQSAIGLRPVHRVGFHEITQEAIDAAFSAPRDIDMRQVDAQQARRILDRIVGYTLSPLLRDKLGRRGLSAGRVQSVAVRLIVDREREVEAFTPEEYWSIEAELAKQEPECQPPRSFTARLHRIRGEEVSLKSRSEVDVVLEDLERSVYAVVNVREGQRRRNPAAPFTTSTLQQEASRRLGMTARRTMAIAQQLYEGVDLGEGPTGLITYMRTDSTQVAETAQTDARRFIVKEYGESFVPDQPPEYKTRAKGAQEAHEAIRPTQVCRRPRSLKPYLDRAQYRLYELIWRRFVASQMAPAVYDTISVEIVAGPTELPVAARPYLFRASGSSLRFKGFLAVYEESQDEDLQEEAEGEREKIPPLTVDELLDLLQLLPYQHFTQPPPRYTEATLVRALEEYGIGRPSTYAPILATIQQRGYVERRENRLHPTEVGVVITDLLVEHFPDYIDVGFTAQMESELDRIATGERQWVPVLDDFYGPFETKLSEARESMPEVDMDSEPTGESCPLCGNPLVYKHGRYGRFVGCSNFPDCRYSAPIIVKTGARCPVCGGELIEKRTRRGRTFYGCSNYRNDDPDSCQFATWKRPLPQACPNCGGLLVEARKDVIQCLSCEETFEPDTLLESEPATA
ncbi:MAG: type I DNA topoisomerase [Chloroflexi bacterium]|nr:type I DNA topoisomerase [Chloroflexota bacterium]